jgi:nucleoid DNA-binding protein
MTKADLVNDVVRRTDIPKRDVAIVVDTFLQSLKDAFKRRDRIELRGFGVFMTKSRKPRIGRNPRTKEEVRIPERTVVVFRPSKLLNIS